MTLGAGEAFAGYTIVRQIGSGGMGEVYLAQHPRLPRQEALKVLNPQISDDETFRQRFIREADSIASLQHPNIVTVHDRGDNDGTLWIATQFVDGTDASRLTRDHYPNGMPVGEACEIATAVAGALDYAHDRGLLHRDVKPANILLSQPDRDGARLCYLADFGIARPLDDQAGLTATNFTLGTFAYAAPEQLVGKTIDGRADQYALAATMFHLLTGRPVFPDSNQIAVISQHLSEPPPAPSTIRPELAPLDPAFARALSKIPQDRFPRCRDFAQALAAAARTNAGYLAAAAAPTQHSPAPSEAIAASAPTQMAPPPGYPPVPAYPGPAVPAPPHQQPNRMPRRTALAVGAVAAVIAVGLVATKQAHSPTMPAEQLKRGGLPDAAALVQQSLATLRSQHSAHLEQETTGTILDWPVNTLTGEVTNQPSNAFEGSANMKLNGQTVNAQLAVVDAILYAALTPNSWLDMGPAAEIFDPSAYLDPNNGLINALSGISDPKSQEFETVNGVPVVRISGMLDPDSANKLFPKAHAQQPIPVNVWIGKDAPNALVKTEIQPSISATITWTLSDWGKPVTVSKPAGAS